MIGQIFGFMTWEFCRSYHIGHLADSSLLDKEEPPAMAILPDPEMAGCLMRTGYFSECIEVITIGLCDLTRVSHADPGTFYLQEYRVIMFPPGNKVHRRP